MSKINIEEYLYQIDQAFAQKEDKEVKMIYAMIFAGLVAFSYLLFWESAELGFNDVREQVTSLDAKLNTDKRYLQVNPESKIPLIEAQTKEIETRYFQVKDNNGYIKNRISQISELYYDEQTWGEFINSISKNAKKYKVKLLDFNNTLAESNVSFGHILDIQIKTSASYINNLKFINSLETSDLIVDVHDLSLSDQKRLITDINLSVWGIIY